MCAMLQTGGFGVVKYSGVIGAALSKRYKRGACQELRCSTPGCGFKVPQKHNPGQNYANTQVPLPHLLNPQAVLEDGIEGAHVRIFKPDHNHPLASSTAEANTDPQARYIPESLHATAESMALSGTCSIADIHRVMAAQASREGKGVTWIPEDLRTRYGATTEERANDVTALLVELRRHQEEKGLLCFTETNEQGELSHVRGCVCAQFLPSLCFFQCSVCWG
jgi:hypothetical protein